MTTDAPPAAADPAPTPKKARPDPSTPTPTPTSPWRPDLLAPASAAALRAAYVGAAPFPHVAFDAALDDALLRAVRSEIVANVTATYKETDLFTMFQTGDLANLDALPPALAARLPATRALRDAIYSPPFRAFVSEVTGRGPLTGAADCACNVHAAGGHLLCHDDVIGTRAVSYIVYLTDPDEPWGEEDGGALELYPEGEGTPHQPATTPTTTLLPAWNRVALFGVAPGASFHAISEVAPSRAASPRMSIQGWFHAAHPPAGAELATRAQLQAGAGEGDGAPAAAFAGPPAPFDAADAAALAPLLNPSYLDASNWGRVAAAFREDGSVHLRKFLAPAWAAALADATAAADAAAGLGRGRRPPYDAGVGGGWAAAGPAHKQRFLRYEAGERVAALPAAAPPSAVADAAGSDPAARAGALLAHVGTHVLGSAPFARLVKNLTSIGVVAAAGAPRVRRFRPGLDYTVAHAGVLTTEPRLDAVLTFADDGGAGGTGASDDLWAAGDVGGYEAYLLADDAGDAAEYRPPSAPGEEGRGGGGPAPPPDDDGGVLNVAPAANALSLVLRDEGLLRFVKCVSMAAPGSRWDVGAVYVPEDGATSEEE